MRSWLAVLWLLGAPALVAEEDELEVMLLLPVLGQAVFGEVEVGAEIYPPDADVSRVEFYLDGRLVGLVERPPYKQVIDAGQENVEHHFEVMVYARSGKSCSSSVRTPRIDTDEEISVDLQQLFVTVERDGQRVLDLRREDFTVFDNGVRQQLITYERGDVPFTAVLLLDASVSMQGRHLEIALEGAAAFVEGMREHDQAKLLLFADRVLHETPFTTFAAVINVGLAGVSAGGGTALNDHLYLAMKRLEVRQGRRVVVILSDGVDVESVLPMDQVQWLASQQQPVLYWIRLNERPELDGAKHRSLWRGQNDHDREIQQLRRTVLLSGGRIETIHRIEEVERAFRWILEDLRDQYVLGYYPTGLTAKKSWHKVLVRVRDSALTVRTRGGYLEPTPWNGRASSLR